MIQKRFTKQRHENIDFNIVNTISMDDVEGIDLKNKLYYNTWNIVKTDMNNEEKIIIVKGAGYIFNCYFQRIKESIH